MPTPPEERHEASRQMRKIRVPTSGLPAMISTYPDVTRVVVVEDGGRMYQHDRRLGDPESVIELSFQDEGATLKIFVTDKDSYAHH